MATSGGLRLITLDMKDCVIRMKRPPILDYIEVARYDFILSHFICGFRIDMYKLTFTIFAGGTEWKRVT